MKTYEKRNLIERKVKRCSYHLNKHIYNFYFVGLVPYGYPSKKFYQKSHITIDNPMVKNRLK